MELEAGELSSRITFQKRVKKKNPIGELEHTWKEVGSYLVKLSTLSQRAAEIAKGFSTSVSHDIKMRFHPEIDLSYRGIFRGEVLTIVGVIHDIDKKWTQVFVNKG